MCDKPIKLQPDTAEIELTVVKGNVHLRFFKDGKYNGGLDLSVLARAGKEPNVKIDEENVAMFRAWIERRVEQAKTIKSLERK